MVNGFRAPGSALPLSTNTKRRIAFFSTAGGGGKTTTVINLAAALAERGLRVLIVDLDPHACLLRAFGLQPRSPLYSALWENESLARWVQPSEFAGVFLLTASPELDTDERLFRAGPGAERRLRKALHTLSEGSWDFILFDCGSGVSRLSVAALAVADEFIAPIEPSAISIGSLTGTLEFADSIRRHENPELGQARILVSRLADHHSATGAAEALRDRFTDQVLATQIPQSSAVVEASAHCEPVLTFEQDGTASNAYRGLASELIAHA
jgi:chromosome partitioning protein